MRRILTLKCALILALAIALPAGATSPLQQASGSGVFTELTIVSSEFAGPNRIEVRRITGAVTGDLTGTWTQEVRGVVHPNGEVTFQGEWSFTGEVGSCGYGTISGRMSGKGAAGPFPITSAAVRTTHLPSNTVAVVGQGTVDQQGPFVTYDIQYRCE
jgi:hypothetical protein